MPNVKKKITRFFRKRKSQYPKEQHGKIVGWLASYRADVFSDSHTWISRLETANLYETFNGIIYELSFYSITGLVAVYSDNTILWLDDHLYNDGFAEFVKREKLMRLFDVDPMQLASIVATLKFNYLGEPRLLHRADDIPPLPDYVSDENKTFFTQRLAPFEAQIHPPQIEFELNQINIMMWLWTRIIGRLFKVNCQFERDGTFSYDGVSLIDGVGYFYIPR